MIELKELTKDDCGEEITLPQMKEILLNMLLEVADFCETNGIRYYLSGGTLLGAIRHKGFIPWDDDIDINIPRPDCEKLMKLSDGRIGKYVLQPPSNTCPYHSEGYRLYDTDMVIETSRGNTSKIFGYVPIFLDIFPIEGLYADDKKLAKAYHKIVVKRKIYNCLDGGLWHGKTFSTKVFHLLCKPVAKMIGYKRLYDGIQKVVTQVGYDESEYIGVMTAPVHTTEERVVKAEYEPIIKVEFEGRMLNAPKGYDVYLKQLYGPNYMEIPPLDKRKSHHGFNVYKRRILE